MEKLKVINRGLDETLFQMMCSRFPQIPALQTLGVTWSTWGRRSQHETYGKT